MHWNHFRASAKHSSARWATTDRGWLILALNEHPDITRDATEARRYFVKESLLCAGNYVAYPGKGVHASAYLFRVGASGSHIQSIPMAETVFSTPELAAAAVEAAVRAALSR